MEELYRFIEDKIKQAGYKGNVIGEDIYDEICDEIENKEIGSYLFMSKKEDDVFFEYKIDVLEDEFNLSYVHIHTPENIITVNFDEEKEQ
ncbi:MAG: hypothetical protein ACRCSG_07260 [Cellulosilyticaceae bacterium]